jgi:hypothetical protein
LADVQRRWNNRKEGCSFLKKRPKNFYFSAVFTIEAKAWIFQPA